MKRTVCAVVVISAWAFAVGAAPAHAETPVSGPITEDTVWTLAASPYVMTGTVTVEDGATLTIEPGVVVRVSSVASLDVFGVLKAIGTEVDRITFERAAEGRWGRIRFANAQSDPSQDAPSVVRYADVWEGSGLFIQGAPPALSINLYVGNSTAVQLPPSGTISVTDNVFLANEIAVSGSGGRVELLRNDFWMNMESITLSGGEAGSRWDVHQNDVISTAQVRRGPPGGVVGASCECDLRVGPPSAVAIDATENWWGTTDSDEIESRIVDQRDDPGFAEVSWNPPSSSPHTQWTGYKARASLELRKHLIARGVITSPEGFAPCYAEVDVIVQLRGRSGWSTLQTTTTSTSGTFMTRLPDRSGRYRVVSSYSLSGPPQGGYCEGGVSPTRRHSHT